MTSEEMSPPPPCHFARVGLFLRCLTCHPIPQPGPHVVPLDNVLITGGLADVNEHLARRGFTRDALVGILGRLIVDNQLHMTNREDTIGVLMRCGAFTEIGKAATATLAAEIDRALIARRVPVRRDRAQEHYQFLHARRALEAPVCTTCGHPVDFHATGCPAAT